MNATGLGDLAKVEGAEAVSIDDVNVLESLERRQLDGFQKVESVKFQGTLNGSDGGASNGDEGGCVGNDQVTLDLLQAADVQRASKIGADLDILFRDTIVAVEGLVKGSDLNVLVAGSGCEMLARNNGTP